MARRVNSDLLLVGSLPADSADSALRAAAGFFGDLVFGTQTMREHAQVVRAVRAGRHA